MEEGEAKKRRGDMRILFHLFVELCLWIVKVWGSSVPGERRHESSARA